MGRKFIQQRRQTMAEMFDALVRNAIDFIDASLDTLDKRPKNGIVDFYTAIELFLKARLMAEHWTLILSKPEGGNLQSFAIGDFHSVFLEDAARRLKEIVGSPLNERALDNFKALGEHRNQIVHFAHTDYSDVAGAKAGVVVEQWTSWHYLHELLINHWGPTFAAYKIEFERLHSRMLEQHAFLGARYKEIESSIKNRIKQGELIDICSQCKMPSALVKETHKWGRDFECLVCQTHGTLVTPTSATVTCDQCGKDFEFFKSGKQSCPYCSQAIDTDKLISLCKRKFTEGDDWWEEGSPHIAECHICKYHSPSVFYIDGLWSCVSCFDRGWQAVRCSHCNEFVTGDMETIKHFACFKCEDDVRRAYIYDES